MNFLHIGLIIAGMSTSCISNKGNIDRMLTDFKPVNEQDERTNNIKYATSYSTILLKDADFDEGKGLMNGNKTVLSFSQSRSTRDVEDAGRNKSLLIVFNKEPKELIGQEIDLSSDTAKGIGRITNGFGDSFQFVDLEGSIQILENTENSILISIKDSLYSSITVYEDTMEGDSVVKNGFSYQMDYKIDFNQIRFVEE